MDSDRDHHPLTQLASGDSHRDAGDAGVASGDSEVDWSESESEEHDDVWSGVMWVDDCRVMILCKRDDDAGGNGKRARAERGKSG